jgi:hypothetical protein
MDTDYMQITHNEVSGKAPVRDLERVETAASRVENVADKLSMALNRYHGCGDPMTQQTKPVATGHFAQLERLAEQIDRIEDLTRRITEIM